MRLADEFFLLALDDRTGRSLLSPRVLGLGLAGALLVELIIERKITVQRDRIVVLDRQPSADPLGQRILAHLAGELSEHEVRTWLVYLARDAREQVATRLRRAGHIRQEQVRRLWRSEVVYPPTDLNAAALPRARLVHSLTRRLPMPWAEVALAGLAVATGLDSHLLYTADDAAGEYLRHLIEHLPSPVHVLVWHAHAAVGDAVITGRA